MALVFPPFIGFAVAPFPRMTLLVFGSPTCSIPFFLFAPAFFFYSPPTPLPRVLISEKRLLFFSEGGLIIFLTRSRLCPPLPGLTGLPFRLEAILPRDRNSLSRLAFLWPHFHTKDYFFCPRQFPRPLVHTFRAFLARRIFCREPRIHRRRLLSSSRRNS